MHRSIAAQPDLFCAYYEPMMAPSVRQAMQQRQILKGFYLRSATTFRNCMSYFK